MKYHPVLPWPSCHVHVAYFENFVNGWWTMPFFFLIFFSCFVALLWCFSSLPRFFFPLHINMGLRKLNVARIMQKQIFKWIDRILQSLLSLGKDSSNLYLLISLLNKVPKIQLMQISMHIYIGIKFKSFSKFTWHTSNYRHLKTQIVANQFHSQKHLDSIGWSDWTDTKTCFTFPYAKKKRGFD